MSFSNPLSLFLGNVEDKNNDGEVFGNPDNLPLSLQQRYLMARAHNLFDNNYTIHNFRDATTGMELAKELNENFRALATPESISKWRPVLESDVLPQHVQFANSFPYYLASEVYNITNDKQNAPIIKIPTTETETETTPTEISVLFDRASSNENNIKPQKTRYDKDFQEAKKEGKALFLSGTDESVMKHFINVISSACNHAITAFARFLTNSIGQSYLESNFIQIKVLPEFGRIHFAGSETNQNLVEFLSKSVPDKDKKVLVNNPLIYTDSYIDFSKSMKGY